MAGSVSLNEYQLIADAHLTDDGTATASAITGFGMRGLRIRQLLRRMGLLGRVSPYDGLPITNPIQYGHSPSTGTDSTHAPTSDLAPIHS